MKTRAHLLVLALVALPLIEMIAVDSKGSSSAEKSAKQVEPSEAFRAYVQSLEIQGVFIGYNSGARAMVNKRLVRPGDVIESELGVRFVAVNPDAKLLVFEDKTGARLTKNFGPGN